MAKSRRSGQGIDIHHPKMVKTVFILTSLAILAFLALIVKTTSFNSDPRAKNPARYPTSNDCYNKYKGTYPAAALDDYSAPTMGSCPTTNGYVYAGWTYGITPVMSIFKCCLNSKNVAKKGDNYCSSIPLVSETTGSSIANPGMVCKQNCSYSSMTDLSNEYKRVGGSYFYKDLNGKVIPIANGLCKTMIQTGNKYKNVIGNCCAK